jgi:poly-gamma-glutamate synthesis protein (capsule biosynthesis protein)
MDIPMQWTRKFVAEAMKAGVDAFIGHHPHVPHGVGWYDGRPALYSLGNLIFPMHTDYPWTGTSFLARFTFQRDGLKDSKPRLEKLEACPYHIVFHTPHLFEGKTREARERSFKSHMTEISKSVGGSQFGAPGEHSCMEIQPREEGRSR